MDNEIISFHPIIPGDRFFWERSPWSRQLCRNLAQARAVILPQTVSREFYALCKSLCPNVFPNYDIRFQWEGKVGDAMLFWSNQVPHPKTIVFPRVESLIGEHPDMGEKPDLPPFPFVLKGAHGGEGSSIWLIRDEEELHERLRELEQLEWHNTTGFVIQEYLPDITRDLRVVVIGNQIVSYWRNNAGSFLHNVARGGTIDFDSDPDMQETGRKAVRDLCRRTAINLAGFDLIFPDPAGPPQFLEINYTFGRTGLGGSERFYGLLKKGVDGWLAALPR